MSREKVDRKPWAMVCDREGCDTMSEPHWSDKNLPLKRFRDEGWFIAKVHGDRCPKCVAVGLVPNTEPYTFRGEEPK